MGTLDVTSAKQQFFTLVDAISASHLPSFTIWLDAKLAEYKTIGQLKPDTEFETKEQYPEWIAKAFRQNLSFIFAGHANSTSHAETPDKGICRKRSSPQTSFSSLSKRSKTASLEPDTGGSEETCIVVKEENPSSPDDTFPVSETPLPGIQSSFSLSYSSAEYSRHQSSSSMPLGPVADASSVQGHLSSSAAVSSQPQAETFSDSNQSLPPPSYSSTSEEFPNAPTSQQFEYSNAKYEFEGSADGAQFPMPVASATSESAGVVPVTSVTKPRVDLSPAAIKGVAVSQRSSDFIMKFHGGKPTYALASGDLNRFRNEAGGFTCPLCQKQVRDFNNYKRHVVIHTHETPFHCPYCDKSFSDRSHCNKHQELRHPDKMKVKVVAQI